MRNKNKFKTLKQRNEAFDAFCRMRNCLDCPLVEEPHCTFSWLELEAETLKTSEKMISDLIEETSGVIIGDEEANRLRKVMMTKLLSHREEIQEIWQAQDKETTDKKQREV